MDKAFSGIYHQNYSPVLRERSYRRRAVVHRLLDAGAATAQDPDEIRLIMAITKPDDVNHFLFPRKYDGFGDAETLRKLLKKGQDPDVIMKDVWHKDTSALRYAVEHCRNDVCLALIEAGAKLRTDLFLHTMASDFNIKKIDRTPVMRALRAKGAVYGSPVRGYEFTERWGSFDENNQWQWNELSDPAE